DNPCIFRGILACRSRTAKHSNACLRGQPVPGPSAVPGSLGTNHGLAGLNWELALDKGTFPRHYTTLRAQIIEREGRVGAIVPN
ncbi:MAG: hypothetical protein ACK6DC_21465, partial [Planctomycetota bacterium]